MSVLAWIVFALVVVSLVAVRRVVTRLALPTKCFICNEPFGGPIVWEDDLITNMRSWFEQKSVYRGKDELWGCRCGAAFHRHCDVARREEKRLKNESGWGACAKCGYVHGAFREGFVARSAK